MDVEWAVINGIRRRLCRYPLEEIDTTPKMLCGVPSRGPSAKRVMAVVVGEPAQGHPSERDLGWVVVGGVRCHPRSRFPERTGMALKMTLGMCGRGVASGCPRVGQTVVVVAAKGGDCDRDRRDHGIAMVLGGRTALDTLVMGMICDLTLVCRTARVRIVPE